MNNDVPSSSNQPTIIVQTPPAPGFFAGWFQRVIFSLLCMSAFLNFMLIASHAPAPAKYTEEFVSGDKDAEDLIAILEISGTIMPPFTERTIEMIDMAKDDEHVKGVLLSIDSPGGFVADSHQIYRKIKKLAEAKPVYVSMKRMAASGGVYVAMGVGEKGKIFAEPTTWTGSIGVIIPRYDVSKLTEKFGVTSDSLTTGPFKDSMNPLKPLTDADRVLWGEIIADSFDRFVKIVDEGRSNLDEATVREKLATGQVFTATQAKANGLIDDIAFEDEVADKLQKDLGLSKVRVVKFKHTPTVIDALLGNVEAKQPDQVWQKVLNASVPRALYYCSWLPALP